MLATAASALLLMAGTALAVEGQLTQLPGTAGCVSVNGAAGCASGRALSGTQAVAVSPDDRYVYTTGSAGVAIFARDTTTGELTQLPGTAGCVSEDGLEGRCADGTAIGNRSIAISQDGKSLYVAGIGRVAAFRRDTATGEVTQLPGTAGCVSETGSGGSCSTARAVGYADSIAVSPDGRNVYIAAEDSDAVAVFSRDTATGELTQLPKRTGCWSETGSNPPCHDGKGLDRPTGVTVSPDGKNVYVSAETTDSIAIFRRNPTTGALLQPSGIEGCVSYSGSRGACIDGRGLANPLWMAMSADGRSFYVASYDGVAAFRRNTATGGLRQLVGPDGEWACIGGTHPGAECTAGKAILPAFGLAVSPDGQSVYTASFTSDSVAVLSRSTTSGALRQHGGLPGCVSETGSYPGYTRPQFCTDGNALDGAGAVAVSGDGRHVYVGSYYSGAVAVFAREAPPSP